MAPSEQYSFTAPPSSAMQTSKMLLSSTPLTSLPPSRRPLHNNYSSRSRTLLRPIGPFVPLRVRAMAKEQTESGNGILEKAAVVAGLISAPVIGWSLFTLKTTGCGLPPGPGGSIGALEGLSYLAVVGIVGWSAYTKVKTGSGLPNGPFGLLGAVEGLSYLSLLAIIVVFVLQFAEQGSLPGPLPSDQCFG